MHRPDGFGSKLEQARRQLQLQVEQLEQARAQSPVLNPAPRAPRRRVPRRQMLALAGMGLLLLGLKVSVISSVLHYNPSIAINVRSALGLEQPLPPAWQPLPPGALIGASAPVPGALASAAPLSPTQP